MASFECIPRFRICESGATAAAGVVEFLELLNAAAMAETGSEIEERRGGRRARKKVEENSLAVVLGCAFCGIVDARGFGVYMGA